MKLTPPVAGKNVQIRSFFKSLFSLICTFFTQYPPVAKNMIQILAWVLLHRTDFYTCKPFCYSKYNPYRPKHFFDVKASAWRNSVTYRLLRKKRYPFVNCERKQGKNFQSHRFSNRSRVKSQCLLSITFFSSNSL